jgi:hypothetical protein
MDVCEQRSGDCIGDLCNRQLQVDYIGNIKKGAKQFQLNQ